MGATVDCIPTSHAPDSFRYLYSVSQLKHYAWYWDPEPTPHGLDHNYEPIYGPSVGLKLPNPWGLYDTHGNLAGFCRDDPGVVRGGSRLENPHNTTSASRDVNSGYFTGFRVLMMGDPPAAVTPQTWGQIKCAR